MIINIFLASLCVGFISFIGCCLSKNEYIFNKSYFVGIIKSNIDVESVKHEFSEKLEHLKSLSQCNELKTFTPELKTTFDEWLGNWMKEFYFKG